MQNKTTQTTVESRFVDNSDWLKTAAIILVTIDHFGYFFVEDNQSWNLLGRLAAPIFFFLLGYAQTRKIPISWIGLGIILTVLDSWNTDWTWVVPNILFSLALIRFARPFTQKFLNHFGWIAFIFLLAGLFLILPVSTGFVEYGAEGWYWALFGLCQRTYVNGRTASITSIAPRDLQSKSQTGVQSPGAMRLLACLVAWSVWVWQEQLEYSFSENQFVILVVGVGILSLWMCLFSRGPSRVQTPAFVTGILHFIGRHTLEIYAFQLAGSEIIINLVPGLAA